MKLYSARQHFENMMDNREYERESARYKLLCLLVQLGVKSRRQPTITKVNKTTGTITLEWI